MSALETPYTLTVTSRTTSGSEVKLQRTTQTIGIPLFQFGVFSQSDLSYFPGPNFNFGGRVHANGNLFLASGGPANATPTQTDVNQLWLSQRVTVVGDVIRDTLSNGHPLSTTSEHPGSVEITTGAGSYQALGFGQGSQIAGLGSGANPNWPAISASYNANLRNGVKPLNMSIVLAGNGTAQPIDIIRRPVQNEDTTNPAVLGERYFAQASLKILISDNPNDITQLPCVSAGAPFNLALLANSTANLNVRLRRSHGQESCDGDEHGRHPCIAFGHFGSHLGSLRCGHECGAQPWRRLLATQWNARSSPGTSRLMRRRATAPHAERGRT